MNAIDSNIPQDNFDITNESTIASNTSPTMNKDNFSSLPNDDISIAPDNRALMEKDPLEETPNNTPEINHQLINEIDSSTKKSNTNHPSYSAEGTNPSATHPHP